MVDREFKQMASAADTTALGEYVAVARQNKS